MHDNQTQETNAHDVTEHVDEQRRRFLWMTAGMLAGGGMVCALTPLMRSLSPSVKARAQGGIVRVDISELKPGQQITVSWRGKPVWILRRTPEMLVRLSEPNAELRDPASKVAQQPAYAVNPYRSIHPEYLVLIGVCTHLGCVPLYEPQTTAHGAYGEFYCPCHGSRFDLAGRVFKHMPAPVNLEVPPYRFIHDHIIEIGEGEES